MSRTTRCAQLCRSAVSCVVLFSRFEHRPNQSTNVVCGPATEDAKCFPAFHPHGTGSVFSEACSGGLQAHSRNRATLIDSRFRKSALWAFWKLDQQIKNELFHANNKRRQYGRPNAAGADDADGFKRSFGSAIPRNIPESSGCSQ